jgi:hypothetical protein
VLVDERDEIGLEYSGGAGPDPYDREASFLNPRIHGPSRHAEEGSNLPKREEPGRFVGRYVGSSGHAYLLAGR